MGILRKLCFAVVLLWALPALAQQQPCIPSQYSSACYGTTVCFLATSSSTGPVIPPNINRKYLLIQSQSTTLPVYFAIGLTSTTSPLIAQVGVNTIELLGQAPMPAHYEINGLDAQSPVRVPSGAISIIAPSGNVNVCFLEHNG